MAAFWGDVYYEDQVIKDGANAQAQAFAVHSFELMARLEAIAGAPEKADRYAALANKMRHNYIQPIPEAIGVSGTAAMWIGSTGRVRRMTISIC